MNRQKRRAAMQERTNLANKQAAARMGLPKGFLQFAKRHGFDAERVEMDRRKFAA